MQKACERGLQGCAPRVEYWRSIYRTLGLSLSSGRRVHEGKQSEGEGRGGKGKRKSRGREWWYSALGKWRQKDQEFKAILGCIVGLKLAYLKKNNEEEKEGGGEKRERQVNIS